MACYQPHNTNAYYTISIIIIIVFGQHFVYSSSGYYYEVNSYEKSEGAGG